MATAFVTKRRTPFLIGVTGGTSCGKTEVCKAILAQLSRVERGSSLSEEEKLLADRGEYNFDHPDAFDTDLILSTLKLISEGKPVRVPRYDFSTCQRLEKMDTFQPTEVVLFEGILVLYYPALRHLLHMKLFVDLDSDTRLCRRVERDTKERGRALKHVLKQYTDLVKPAFEEFTLPSKKYADVIIPRGIENRVAVCLIVEHIVTIVEGSTPAGGRVRRASSSEAETGRKRHSSLTDSKSRPH